MPDWDPRLTALVDAAVEDPALAKQLVEADPTILVLRTGLGETALHFLAVENYASGVQVLIDLGADVNVTNQFGATPVEEARMSGANEAVEVLLRAGAVAPRHTYVPAPRQAPQKVTLELGESPVRKCDECESDYFAVTSYMCKLCPECASLLYDYPNCEHVFVAGRCETCGWDGSRSEFFAPAAERAWAGVIGTRDRLLMRTRQACVKSLERLFTSCGTMIGDGFARALFLPRLRSLRVAPSAHRH